MKFEMSFSRKSINHLEEDFLLLVLKRILLWIIISGGIAGLFLHIKKETNFYLATLPQIINSKIYSDTEVFPIRGLHVTSHVAGSPELFKKLVDLVNKTELNAMVIDLKEADGRVSYDSRLEIVKNLGTKRAEIKNLDKLLAILKENNIFPIARICVFKDPVLAEKCPHIAVKDKNGSIWRDKKGLAWVDPYCKQVWEYNTAIAEEVAQRGFKEIQFDYIRFPSDGIISNCVYPCRKSNDDSAPFIAIKNFLRYAAVRLRPYGVIFSVDVFGLTCTAEGDLNIGQIIEEMASEVDYICPMVYPSHYRRGEYKIPDPESNPYKTVYNSLQDAQRRIGKICRIRPWLQDFSLRVKYSANDVREQIRATYENGIQEWLLWNPACRYTTMALKPKMERSVLVVKKTSTETNVQSETSTGKKYEVELPEEKF